ncbi:MAG: DUF4914 domain-containing protein [Dictyoglomus sp. NZ13-RE01]|nr:MAG: DUF4914 domain-containing protein [Dictyoglomus sp. NZ13-RE01]
MVKEEIEYFIVPKEVEEILHSCKSIFIPEKREEFFDLATGWKDNLYYEVKYFVPGKGEVVEATVTRCKNGIVVNYPDVYMRRRDPDSMVIGDEGDTDKPTFKERFGEDFDVLRQKTFDWLKEQDLIVMPFMAGGEDLGYEALLISPLNAAFFAGGLADIQGFIPRSKLRPGFKPIAIIYLAPPFRHTHFDGKQIVVHNRINGLHEIFSYNLYPGPSAKKGVYGFLITIGEIEGWVSAHASTVKIITPYDNVLVIMHEGASGGGKSEMTQQMHREKDNRVLLGTNIVTGEKYYIEIQESCEIHPVTDDIALCHPKLQTGRGKMVVKDAEQGWFVRLDNITQYGTDPQLERLCIHPPEPLIFLNLEAHPGATALIWEHIMDEPGKPCPNPRVIIPRRFISNIVNEPVEVDVRSFGLRTPPCTKEKPSYGIVGLFHVLPPALAWLWRLVSPRGYANPSITDTDAMSSEGVGSYWPFATGKMVKQANLLLEQILEYRNTQYILVPNQHIGAYKVGFMPQWIVREYLAKRGSARLRPEQLKPARCALLGFALEVVKVEGHYIPKAFLQVDQQPEVGIEAYDKGAEILKNFFKNELKKFISLDLDPLGKQIIECCLDDGTLEDYINLIPPRR